MKDEVNNILKHLEYDEDILLLRNWLLFIDAGESNQMQQAVAKVLDAIKQVDILDIQKIGVYYLLLGCLCYEQSKHDKSVEYSHNAINKIWNSRINKSLAHWLLGLSYYNLNDFPKARRELQEALKLLTANTSVNTLRSNTESKARYEIREKIRNALERLFDEPLFRSIPPTPSKEVDPTSAKNPHSDQNIADREKTQAKAPFNGSNETPTNGNYVYQEIHTGVNISFQVFPPTPPASTQNYYSTFPQNPEPEVFPDDNKEDILSPVDMSHGEGYITFLSLPVYEQKAAAGNLGEPAWELNEMGFAETQSIIINNKQHKIYPIRNANEIKVTGMGKRWGWVQIQGYSMNNIKNHPPIMDGDFVLLQFAADADDNDIVLASFEDPQTAQKFLVIKRYRKTRQTLHSETTEKGKEYEDINLANVVNPKIIGIAFAVAKPSAP